MKKKLHAGFTLVEMMIVLLIISVLVLLFIPNLAQEKDTVLDKGNHAIVESMKTQIELQEFSTGKPVTEEYIKDNLIKGDAKKQALYNEYIKGE